MADQDTNWANQQLRRVALTDIGRKRSKNQDALTVVLADNQQDWQRRGHFFMVADGMGAHAAGELASTLAVSGVAHLYRKYTDVSSHEALVRAMVETNLEIFRRGQANPDFLHMGTTGSTLVLLPQGALIAHVGDSRVYRLRETLLCQLTRDHSLLWELTRSGHVSPNASFIPKNVITRSLGPSAGVDVDIEGPFPVEVGDKYLLCSDGLTGKVSDEELAVVLANLPIAEAGQVLIDLANLRGGPDNITVILVEVLSPELATPEVVAEPLRQGEVRPEKHLHPVVLVIIPACFLASFLLFVIGNLPASWIALAAGLICSLAVWIDRFVRTSKGVALGNGRHLGGAPYATVECPSPKELSASLASLAEEWRTSREAAALDIDWGEFDAARYNAAAATDRRDDASALRFHAQVAGLLMQQLRQAMNPDASDSAIEL